MTIDLKDRLYTSSEVAEILGVSLRSVYRYLEEGKLNADIKTATGRHRFSRQNIIDFLKPQEEEVYPNQKPVRPESPFSSNYNSKNFYKNSDNDFSLDNVVDDFDFKFDDDLDLDTPSIKGNQNFSTSIDSRYPSNDSDFLKSSSSGSSFNSKIEDSELSDEELDKLFDEIINGDTSSSTSKPEAPKFIPQNTNNLSSSSIFNQDFWELDEEDDSKDLLDDEEFDEIFKQRSEQKSTFSWRGWASNKQDSSYKNDSISSHNMTKEEDDFSWLDDLLGDSEEDSKDYQKTSKRDSNKLDLADNFFDDLDVHSNTNNNFRSNQYNYSDSNEDLIREEEEYQKKLKEIREIEELRQKRNSLRTTNSSTNSNPRSFYNDFPAPKIDIAPKFNSKSSDYEELGESENDFIEKEYTQNKNNNRKVSEPEVEKDDWISRFRKATENLDKNSRDNTNKSELRSSQNQSQNFSNKTDSFSNKTHSSDRSLSDKIDDFFSGSSSSVSIKDNSQSWLSKLGSSQKEQYFYKSGIGNLKEIAQQLDKIAKKFDLDYSFTLQAGLSLHKPIAPFSTIHAYVTSADVEIFEDYLKLSSCDADEAHICLIIPKSINIFEESYELHGLSVVSNIQLRSDFIDRGLDNLAREV